MDPKIIVAAICGAAAGAVAFFADQKNKKVQKKMNDSFPKPAAPSYSRLPSTQELQTYVDKLIEETSDYDDPIYSYGMERETISDSSLVAQRLLLTACFAMVVYMYPETDRNLGAVAEMLSTSFYAYDNMANRNALDYMIEASDLWLKGEISENPPILLTSDHAGQFLEDWCRTLRGLTPSTSERRYLGFVIEQYKSYKGLVNNDNVNSVIKNALFRVRRYSLENTGINI